MKRNSQKKPAKKKTKYTENKRSNFGKLPANGFVRQSQLIPDIIPVSSATLWRMVKSGVFPKPVKLSERVTAWPVDYVREWIKKQQEV